MRLRRGHRETIFNRIGTLRQSVRTWPKFKLKKLPFHPKKKLPETVDCTSYGRKCTIPVSFGLILLAATSQKYYKISLVTLAEQTILSGTRRPPNSTSLVIPNGTSETEITHNPRKTAKSIGKLILMVLARLGSMMTLASRRGALTI